MTVTAAPSGRKRGRGVSVVSDIILLARAVVAVLTGRGTIAIPGFGQDDNAAANLAGQSGFTTVQAVIGSEKKAFFEDPGVWNIFAEHGYQVPGIDPPAYDTLETLIERISASYSPAGGPESSPEDD